MQSLSTPAPLESSPTRRLVFARAHCPENNGGILKQIRLSKKHITLSVGAGTGPAITSILSVILMLMMLEGAKAQTAAMAQFTDVSLGGGNFQYNITLDNTGSVSLETFWFAWVPGQDYLDSSPTGIVSPTNWTEIITHGGSNDGYAIQWKTSTAALAANGTLQFTFDSTMTPAQMAGDSAFYPTTPAGTSFVYSGQPLQGTSDEFIVTAAAVPEPSTVGLLVAGLLALCRPGVRLARVHCLSRIS
jgi:hypothetical protein